MWAQARVFGLLQTLNLVEILDREGLHLGKTDPSFVSLGRSGVRHIGRKLGVVEGSFIEGGPVLLIIRLTLMIIASPVCFYGEHSSFFK